MTCQVCEMPFHFSVGEWKEGPLLRVYVDIGGIKGEELLLPKYQRTGVKAYLTVFTAVQAHYCQKQRGKKIKAPAFL